MRARTPTERVPDGAISALFGIPLEVAAMTWAELFDATADLDVTVDEIRETLREHREGSDA